MEIHSSSKLSEIFCCNLFSSVFAVGSAHAGKPCRCFPLKLCLLVSESSCVCVTHPQLGLSRTIIKVRATEGVWTELVIKPLIVLSEVRLSLTTAQIQKLNNCKSQKMYFCIRNAAPNLPLWVKSVIMQIPVSIIPCAIDKPSFNLKPRDVSVSKSMLCIKEADRGEEFWLSTKRFGSVPKHVL